MVQYVTTTTLLSTVLSLAVRSFVSAAQVNVTVDDSQTSSGASLIQYTPSTLWNDGTNCSGCTAHPDASRAMDGTWHDSTHAEGAGDDGLSFATLTFTGTAIYVYGILAHTSTSPDGNSDMLFSMDGQNVGSFALSPTNQTTYDYNVLLYANRSIPSGSHTFVLQNGRVGGAKSLVLLDYIVYTHDDGTSSVPPLSASSPPSSPSIAGESPLPASQPQGQMATQSISPFSSTSATGLGFISASAVSSPEVSLTPLAKTITSTDAEGSVVTVSVTMPLPPPSTSSAGNNPSVALASADSKLSSRTRTILIASIVPGIVVLALVIIVSIVCYRRRTETPYHSESQPVITEDPGASGWTSDAWTVKVGSTPSNHGHSTHSHGDNMVAGSSSSLPREAAAASGSRTIPAAASRPRGLTTSSAVTASSRAMSPASEYSHASFGVTGSDLYQSESSTGRAHHATEQNPRTRHPYAARTPEPQEDLDGFVGLLPAGSDPSQSSPEPSSSSATFFDMSSPSTPLHAETRKVDSNTPLYATPLRPPPRPAARPLPLRPILESPAQAARLRRFFPTPSMSSDRPPSYDAVSGDNREVGSDNKF